MSKLPVRSALKSHWNRQTDLGAPWPLFALGFALIVGLAFC